jgi:DNA-binding MarR family transcriptional regulator
MENANQSVGADAAVESVQRDAVEIRVLSALRRLIRATDLDAKNLARQTNLSTSQLLVMEILAADGELTIGRIAGRVGLAQATVTVIVDRLAERDLVVRRRSDADRRQVVVSLTRPGSELFARAPTALQTTFVRNFATLKGWEKTAILSSLERLADLMEVEDLDASPVLDVGTIGE